MPCAGSAAAQSHKAKGRRLTPRSSGAPPAGHQARALLWFILHRAGLASCRRRPLTSNVMHPALVSIANITWLGCVPGIRAARVQASRQSNVQWPRGPVASVALRRCSKNMNLVAFHGRGPLSLQGSVRKPSAFDSSQQARARKPRWVFSIGDFDLALHNNSFEPTRFGSRRLAAPGHVSHRPSAASRRLPTRSAQLER